jgi:archaellum component FlaC
MSLLSKVFIFLVLLAAAFAAFTTATLYFHRQDFRDKWIREAHAHAQTARLKDAEIAHLRNVADHQEQVIAGLQARNQQLEQGMAYLQSQLSNTNQQLQQANAQVGRLNEALRQLMTQSDTLLVLVQSQNQQIAQLQQERDTALQEARNARAQLLNTENDLNIVQRQLSEAEDRVVELSRENNRLQQQIDAVRRRYPDVEQVVVDGGQPVDGFVRGVDPETRLVVISVGHEAGVRAGQEFTVYRDGVYVAKLKIERVDRDWAAGRYQLEVYVPRVGDRVSNRIMQGRAAAPAGGR